ncbi:hypothetical protein [Brevibacillus borstelensis]|uniref:hypothetical protein n=1 Tax=Brevibacillus borstelensis TaxID=45462 RepID=UPI0030C3E659
MIRHYVITTIKTPLIAQPTLENDELEEMNRLIHQSRHEDFAVIITWFVPEVDGLA